mgnify:CR=1 FL=1
MARTLNVHLDERSEQALRVLRGEQMGEEEAVQLALQEAAERRGSDQQRYREQALADLARLANDPSDRAHVLAISAQMAELSSDLCCS